MLPRATSLESRAAAATKQTLYPSPCSAALARCVPLRYSPIGAAEVGLGYNPRKPLEGSYVVCNTGEGPRFVRWGGVRWLHGVGSFVESQGSEGQRDTSPLSLYTHTHLSHLSIAYIYIHICVYYIYMPAPLRTGKRSSAPWQNAAGCR